MLQRYLSWWQLQLVERCERPCLALLKILRGHFAGWQKRPSLGYWVCLGSLGVIVTVIVFEATRPRHTDTFNLVEFGATAVGAALEPYGVTFEEYLHGGTACLLIAGGHTWHPMVRCLIVGTHHACWSFLEENLLVRSAGPDKRFDDYKQVLGKLHSTGSLMNDALYFRLSL